MNDYQTEIQKLDDLATELDSLKENVLKGLKNKLLEGHPPLWSGEIQDLENFTTELREWVDEPKLKEVKDITREFQGICDDKRKFQFGENKSYYISILDVLIQGKEILSNINNDNIKKEAARVILDQVFQQNEVGELEIEINKIKEFGDEFNEKITNFDAGNDDFIEEVKNESIENLIKTLKTDFNSDEITEIHIKIEKAKKSRKLIKEIGSDAFLSSYKKNRDIDNIWDISDEIRKGLDSTNVDTSSISKDIQTKIFSELINYINSRSDALKEPTLTRIKEKLDDLFGKLSNWSHKVNNFIDEDIVQLDTWSMAIEKSKADSKKIQEITAKIADLRQKLNTLKFDEIKDLKTKGLYDAFEEYYAITGNIEDFFKDLLNENARRILDNLSNLGKIKDELGDDFWKSTKELCDTFPQLKIKIEWAR